MIIKIPDELQIEKVLLSQLQRNWSNFINYPYTQNIGDGWIAKLASPILQVPSAIVPNEFNFIINQNHKDFNKISLLNIEDFIFDSRLIEKSSI